MEGIKDTLGHVNLEWQGRLYRLARPSVESEDNFQLYLEDVALRRIKAHEAKLGQVGRREALAEWNRDCTAGVYSLDGDQGIRCVNHPTHLREFTWITLCQEDGQRHMERDEGYEIYKANQGKVLAFWRDFFARRLTTPSPDREAA